MLKLRKFLPEDLERVLEISRASFPQPWPKSEFEKYQKGIIIAEDRRKIVGFIIGSISRGAGQIKLIAVDLNSRGRGVGKSLVEYLLNYFQRSGAKTVIARARTKNESGISFLKNFGFEIIQTLENYYPNGDSAYLMRKKLGN